MFKNIMKIWSEQAFTAKVVDEFLSMLETSERMMSYSFRNLVKKKKSGDDQEEIYAADRSINVLEQDIRKRVLVHISANPRCNVPACLVLISIVKDAERLGDYVKNFYELPHLLKDSKSNRKLFRVLIDDIGSSLVELFHMTIESFRNTDKVMSNNAVNSGHEIARNCERLIEEVVESDYTLRQAVVLALGARYMKRIALHLANIASSVNNPFTEMDYLLPGQK